MDVALPQLVFAVQGAEALQFFVEGGRVLRCGGIGRAVGEIDLQRAAAFRADPAPAQQRNAFPLIQRPKQFICRFTEKSGDLAAWLGGEIGAAPRIVPHFIAGERVGMPRACLNREAHPKIFPRTFAAQEKSGSFRQFRTSFHQKMGLSQFHHKGLSKNCQYKEKREYLSNFGAFVAI